MQRVLFFLTVNHSDLFVILWRISCSASRPISTRKTKTGIRKKWREQKGRNIHVDLTASCQRFLANPRSFYAHLLKGWRPTLSIRVIRKDCAGPCRVDAPRIASSLSRVATIIASVKCVRCRDLTLPYYLHTTACVRYSVNTHVRLCVNVQSAPEDLAICRSRRPVNCPKDRKGATPSSTFTRQLRTSNMINRRLCLPRVAMFIPIRKQTLLFWEALYDS